jgi:hypothetical protein
MENQVYTRIEIMSLLDKDAIASNPSCKRQTNEGQRTYDSCLLYLALGSRRTLEEVATLDKKTIRNIKKVASDFDWIKRATDYDKSCSNVEIDIVLSKLDPDVINSVKSCLQWEDEPSHCYRYFCVYLVFEDARSLEKTADVCGKSSKAISNFSSQYRWVDRARDYDKFCMAVVIKEMTNLRIRRKIKMLQNKWELADLLENKGIEMIKVPLRKERDENGNIIEAARWKMEDAVKFIDLSSRLRTESVDEPKMDILEAVKVLSDNNLLPPGIAEAAALEIQQIGDRIKTQIANLDQ